MSDAATQTALSQLQTALQHFKAGELEQAIRVCRDIVVQSPRIADAHHLLGISLHSAGQSDDGVDSIRRAIELSPNHTEFQTNLGKLLRDMGDLDQAFEVFEKAAKSNPDDATAQFNYGQALNKRDQFAAALDPLRRATELKPDYISAWNSLGNAYSKLKRSQEAAEAYSHVPADHSLAASSLLGRAKSLKDAEQTEEAIALLEAQTGLVSRPSLVTTLVDLYASVGRNEEAHTLGQQCLDYLDKHPEAAEADERGVLSDEEAAEKAHERIAALHHILSTVCQRLLKFDQADQHLAEMAKFTPDSNKSKLSKGIFDYRIGNFADARTAFEELLADDPDHEEARSNLSLIDLAEGKFDNGWERYKSRFQSTASWNENTKRLTRPRWGGQSLDGKTILLVSEQGMGDTIQFIRYAQALKQRYDCTVYFCGPQKILALLTTVKGIDRIFSSIDAHESYDYWAPLLDLPHRLGHNTCDDFPADMPVMLPGPDRVAAWGDRVAKLASQNNREGLRIGIAWQGSKKHVGDAFRSFPLQLFAPIADLPNVDLFSLQLGAGSEQIDEVKNQWPIHTLGEDFDAGEDAFLDAAAVMTNLDVFIGCDSSLIHLAGSLGVPAWVLLSKVPDWRWMVDRTDSPWYPQISHPKAKTSSGMKLWRQADLGRWPDVFARIAKSLSSETRTLLIAERNARIKRATDGVDMTQPINDVVKQGVELHQAGKLDDALAIYELALLRCPSHPDALQLAGVIDSSSGRYDVATKRIGTAVALRPNQATFLGNYAHHLRAAGQPELAIRKLHSAVALSPSNQTYFSDLITLLHKSGRHDEAAKLHIEKANHAATPAEAAAAYRLAAKAAIRANQDDAAIDGFQKALAIQPDQINDWLRLGNLFFNQAKDEQAIEAFDKATKLEADRVEAIANRGVCHWRLQDASAAEADYKRTLELEPDHANTLVNYGIMLRSQNRLVEADKLINRGYALNPDSESAQVQYAATLRNAGRLDDAMNVLVEAKRSHATLPVLNGIGTIHLVRGEMPEARKAFGEAAKLDARHPSVTLNLAILNLLEGKFREGLPDYEFRREVARMSGITTGTPQWDGKSLDGKTILLINEQGWGDTFHFVRYAEFLKSKFDCQVHLAVRRPLLALAGLWPHIDRVFPVDSVDPTFDCWAYLMSLPLLLKQYDESDFPAKIPYLASDEGRDARWAGWMQEIASPKSDTNPDGLRVGIAWQGSRANARDAMRSFALKELAPLAAIDGVTLVSLQSGDGEEQIDDPELGFKVVRPNELTPDHYEVDGDGAFIDAASIIKNLDLVITCDSAICHLAAGLGVPTWIALARVPDWRWMLDRKDSPWYPDVRLFRQSETGNWKDVFQKVADALRESKPFGSTTSQIVAGSLREPTSSGASSSQRESSTIDLGNFNRMVASRHGWLIYNRHDAYIGKSIEMLGEFSEGEVELFAQLLRTGDHVVEAGSNIGSHTVPLAKLVGKNGRVYAFEPQRMVHQTLSANIAANSLTNVEARWAGLGREAGHLDVPELNFATKNNFGGLSLSDGLPGEGTKRRQQSTTRVNLMTLDSLNLPKLRMIKADVEGMEEEVLRGATETIQRCRPAMYLENDRKDKKEALQSYVKSLGYRLFDHIVPMYRPSNFFECRNNPFGNIHSFNLLALPAEFDLKIDGLVEVKG